MIIIDVLFAVTVINGILAVSCALLEKIPDKYIDRLLRLLRLK